MGPVCLSDCPTTASAPELIMTSGLYTVKMPFSLPPTTRPPVPSAPSPKLTHTILCSLSEIKRIQDHFKKYHNECQSFLIICFTTFGLESRNTLLAVVVVQVLSLSDIRSSLSWHKIWHFYHAVWQLLWWVVMKIRHFTVLMQIYQSESTVSNEKVHTVAKNDFIFNKSPVCGW